MATSALVDTCSDTLLGSLALFRISVLPDDHISSFIPFLATLFVEKNVNEINVDLLVNDFPERYGFKIPRMPMLAILKNCLKKSIIRREIDGHYYVVMQKAVDFCFSKQACQQSKKYDIIFQKLSEYLIRSHKKTELTIEQAESMFLAFITDHSARTLSIKSDKDLELQEYISSKNNYLVATFIKFTFSNDYTTFELIQEIASAYIIASAMISEIDSENEESYKSCQYNSLVLYLDTPILLRILGLNTDEMQTSYEALLQELSCRNNVFKIFQHTYDELQGILSDCEKWIENPHYVAKYASPALRTFISKKYKKVDISLYILTLDEKLKKHKIEVDDTDYYSSSYHYLQIDEAPIRNAIISTYQSNTPNFNFYAKEYTIECDVKSISAIFKLRRKKVYNSYSKAKYLFITNNTTLSYISRKFTADQNPSSSHRVYPCVTDVLLGTSIWLSSSVEKVDTFSRKKLLADCSVSLMPAESLVISLSESIERLYNDPEKKLSKEQYYLLKTYGFDNSYLQDKTLNDESGFSDKITEEILEEIKNEISAPYIAEINKNEQEIDGSKKLIEKLTHDKETFENEQKQINNDAEESARDKIRKIEIVLIPIFIASLALVVVILTNVLSLPQPLNFILNIVSALITLISAILLPMIHYNTFNLRTSLEKMFKDKYLIDNFKKKL